jgi:peptidoglycan/LPS O-acetylase OafA/YrhL
MNTYRSDIQGLRGLAILAVVLFHLFSDIVTGGFIGVDIFFVISGFLITRIIIERTSKNKFQLIDFYKARVLRIFPPLITILLVSFIFGKLTYFPNEF